MAREIREVPTTRAHIDWLASHARPEEILEVRSSDDCNMYDAILWGYLGSELCRTVLCDDTPVAVWGIYRDSWRWVRPWFLGSLLVPGIWFTFLRESKRRVKEVMKTYPNMRNWCDARYTKSLDWIRWLGFNVDPPAPYGVRGDLFCRFWIEDGGDDIWKGVR